MEISIVAASNLSVLRIFLAASFGIILFVSNLNGESVLVNAKNVQHLHVAAINYEPFMYQDSDDQAFSKGIEFELIKTIAKKENMDLSIKNRLNPFKYCEK